MGVVDYNKDFEFFQQGNRLNTLFEHTDFDHLLANLQDDSSSKLDWIKDRPHHHHHPQPPHLTFVLVWLSLSWGDFITFIDIIRICGHVMDDVITIWWLRESWYDFSPFGWNFRLGVILLVLVSFYILVRSTESWYDFSLPWLKFSSWCDSVWFGVVSYLGAINCILVWFFFFW